MPLVSSADKGTDLQSVLTSLAEIYRRDLLYLNSLDTSIIVATDLRKLRPIALKYGIQEPITEENYLEVMGQLMSIIRDKMESLGIEHILESQRRKMPSKKVTMSMKEEPLPPHVEKKSKGGD